MDVTVTLTGDLTAAQRQMDAGYIGGAPGVLTSGLAWLVAGFAWLRYGIDIGFATLFVGGMLIVPGALLIAKLAGAPPVAPANPLNRLAIESTVVLFAALLIGYLLLRAEPALTFPALAIVIGARYFSFRTLYGSALFWALGAAMGGAGTLAALGWLPPVINLALLVGAIESVFAAMIWFGRRSA